MNQNKSSIITRQSSQQPLPSSTSILFTDTVDFHLEGTGFILFSLFLYASKNKTKINKENFL